MSGLDHVQDTLMISLSLIPQYKTVLSWDFLAWILVKDRIPLSFTNFITTPELSGLLYMSPDIYHTQITEYSLESIYIRNYSRWALSSCIKHPPNCYSVRPSPFNLYNHLLIPNWSFREHLSRSLPTEMILYLLRSIRSECLTHDPSGKLMRDTLEIIIKWLQVSVSPPPQTKDPICI